MFNYKNMCRQQISFISLIVLRTNCATVIFFDGPQIQLFDLWNWNFFLCLRSSICELFPSAIGSVICLTAPTITFIFGTTQSSRLRWTCFHFKQFKTDSWLFIYSGHSLNVLNCSCQKKNQFIRQTEVHLKHTFNRYCKV